MKTKILICHTSKSVATLLKNYLGSEKLFDTEIRTDIKSTLKCAFEFDPNLIIVGKSFEDGDGLDLIKALRQAQITETTPIIGIPSNGDEQITAAYCKAGAYSVIGFPIAYQDFISTVNHILSSGNRAAEANYSSHATIDNSHFTILVAEDSLSYQQRYKSCIEKLNCKGIFFENGKEAWDALRDGLEVDLIISDIIMPVMDGKDFTTLVRNDFQYNNIPLIVASTIGQLSTLEEFFNIGVNDYFTKPFTDEIFTCRINAHLRTRQLLINAEKLQHELTSFNEKLQLKVGEKTQELRESKFCVIHKLANVTEFRDSITGSHIHRVRAYTEAIAKGMGMRDEKAKSVGIGSLMHDVGKIAIPDSILKKPGKLTPEEREVMEQHTTHGEKLFNGEDLFEEARLIAGGHHEKWDGSGYPRQKKGHDIPIEARIVAIADVFDALLSPRPYKEAFSMQKTMGIINEGKGSHFDPQTVDCLIDLLEDGTIGGIIEQYPYEAISSAM